MVQGTNVQTHRTMVRVGACACTCMTCVGVRIGTLTRWHDYTLIDQHQQLSVPAALRPAFSVLCHTMSRWLLLWTESKCGLASSDLHYVAIAGVVHRPYHMRLLQSSSISYNHALVILPVD